MRGFEKISFNEFKKNIKDDFDLYNSFSIPERKTENSAGYDFYLLEDITLKKREVKVIPTGIKAFMESDEVLLIVIRSSIGFKYNIRLTNQLGVIDAGYYNNNGNEGHIFISIQNEGDKQIEFKKNDRIAQGIFINYLKTNDDVKTKRTGGVGSTKKEEK